VLKKAGIIAAVAVAGVIGLTPLAFANNDTDVPSMDTTTVEKSNQNVDCDFENTQTNVGAGGLLGLNVGVPVNATIPIASCNNFNVEDVVDAGTNNPNVEQASTR
jgi:hypothetical protein